MKHYLCVICSVLESLDSSCTLESNNWAEALNSGGRTQRVHLHTEIPQIPIILLLQSNNNSCFEPGIEEQHWSLSQDLPGLWWECTDSIWCCAEEQTHKQWLFLHRDIYHVWRSLDVYHINSLVDDNVFQLAHLDKSRAFSSRGVRRGQLDTQRADYEKSLVVHLHKVNMNHHPNQREDDGTRQDCRVLDIKQKKNYIGSASAVRIHLYWTFAWHSQKRSIYSIIVKFSSTTILAIHE